MASFVFNFSDAGAQKSFVERCVRDRGIDRSSLYVSEGAEFVIVENLNPGTVEELRNEKGVESVFEDAPLEPF